MSDDATTASIVVNGDTVEVSAGATVSDLIEQLGLTKRLIVVEHNGEPLRRVDHPLVVLVEGDRLELVKAVAGG